MKRNKTVDEFFKNLTQWQTELKLLREIILETNLEETIKWGAPTYTYNKKNVVGLSAFKSYFGLWFFQGGLLKDSANKLINAQEGKTKALRQWRFNTPDEIDKELIKSYILASVENFKNGIEIKPNRNKKIQIPDELKNAFKLDKSLEEKFKALTMGKKREYAEHIANAKRAATRKSRLEKCIPLILSGVGLNDKYKNC